MDLLIFVAFTFTFHILKKNLLFWNQSFGKFIQFLTKTTSLLSFAISSRQKTFFKGILIFFQNEIQVLRVNKDIKIFYIILFILKNLTLGIPIFLGTSCIYWFKRERTILFWILFLFQWAIMNRMDEIFIALRSE